MKLKEKKSLKKTLSDKIADALTVESRADIEDDQVFGTKPKTVSRDDLGSSDSDVEAAISDFHKQNINLLSEVSKKYEGQIVSRKDLDENEYENTSSDGGKPDTALYSNSKQDDFTDSENELLMNKKKTLQSDSEDFDTEDESEDYSITKLQKQSHDSQGSGDSENDDDDDEGEGFDISQLEEPMHEDFEHVKKQNISEEAKKGISVKNQLLLWEGLLEMRIYLQRCVNTANQMPMYDTYNNFKSNHEFLEESIVAKNNIVTVLDKLMSLQNLLLSKYPETKILSSNCNAKHAEINLEIKAENDEEIPSDTDNEEIPSDTEGENDTLNDSKLHKAVSKIAKKRKLEDYETELSKSYKSFKTFRDTSIQKWNEKIRLGTATNLKNVSTNTVLQQISYILSDREKLVRRTQLKRSEYNIIGYKNIHSEDENKDENQAEIHPVTRDRKYNDEYISEIFDDSDFYHQLLRELIECKSADISDPVQLSRQWIALQQMRSKMKRKVDTKATKGRRIKYVAHNKLVNFMAPEKCTMWTDESKNELYSSLFGKMFEQNNIAVDASNGFTIKK